MTLTLLWLAACTNDVQPDDKDTDSGTTDTVTDTGPVDADADGYDVTVDCDDADENVHPDAQERCDTADVDEDCDGLVDDADDSAIDQGTWYADADADGYGDDATAVQACDSTTLVAVGGDCDDASAGVNPGATEVCDDADTDEDCDGDPDDEDDAVTGTITVWLDLDADGYGDPDRGVEVCDPVAGQVDNGDDCDDSNDAAHPGAIEVCDPYDADEDCDGLVEDADDSVTGTTAAWTDADGDGYGDPATEVAVCDTAGLVLLGEDCDDTDPARSPANIWYPDVDADTFGDPDAAFSSCEDPEGAVTDATDCDDTRADVNPLAMEVCDADDVDENCNGVADDDDGDTDWTTMSMFYRDGDKDSWGDPADVAQFCERPTGYVAVYGDCDDTRSFVNPDETEICNDGLDDNCDATDDETCEQSGEVRLNNTTAHAVVTGLSADGQVGLHLRGVGDVTGDGEDDLLVGARQWSETESGGGAAFLYASPMSALTTTDATTTFLGSDAEDALGNAFDAGDFDGDGVRDLVIAAGSADGAVGDAAGWVGLWFGPFDAAEDRATADMSWEGAEIDDYQGWALAAGDVNGDGADDMVWTSTETAGVHVVAGPVTRGSTPTADLWATGDGINASPSTLSIGDIDADGVDEIVVSAYFRSLTDTGVVWILDGSASGADLDSAALARLSGDDALDFFGIAIDVGDGNDDGYADLAVSATGVDDGASDGGAVYIYNGPLSGEYATSDAMANVLGYRPTGYLGTSVAWGGDFDRQGGEDLVVGASKDDTVRTDSGAAAIYYGALTGSLDLNMADFMLLGTGTVDEVGDMVSAAGDIDGDGTGDIAVAAPLDDDGATDGGAVFVVTGSGR